MKDFRWILQALSGPSGLILFLFLGWLAWGWVGDYLDFARSQPAWIRLPLLGALGYAILWVVKKVLFKGAK